MMIFPPYFLVYDQTLIAIPLVMLWSSPAWRWGVALFAAATVLAANLSTTLGFSLTGPVALMTMFGFVHVTRSTMALAVSQAREQQSAAWGSAAKRGSLRQSSRIARKWSIASEMAATFSQELFHPQMSAQEIEPAAHARRVVRDIDAARGALRKGIHHLIANPKTLDRLRGGVDREAMPHGIAHFLPQVTVEVSAVPPRDNFRAKLPSCQGSSPQRRPVDREDKHERRNGVTAPADLKPGRSGKTGSRSR